MFKVFSSDHGRICWVFRKRRVQTWHEIATEPIVNVEVNVKIPVAI